MRAGGEGFWLVARRRVALHIPIKEPRSASSRRVHTPRGEDYNEAVAELQTKRPYRQLYRVPDVIMEAAGEGKARALAKFFDLTKEDQRPAVDRDSFADR